jgi:hypothetical protein
LLLGLFVLSFGLAPRSLAQVHTLDFENLREGQVVDSARSAGGFGPIRFFGSNLTNTPDANAAVLYDSHCAGGCTGGDPDLGSPNVKFGGPGIGLDGGRERAINNSALGNVLIVHEYPREIAPMENGLPGVVDPDDEGGATSIVFTFPEPVTLFSFTIIDRESNEKQNVALYDAAGSLLGLFTTPVTGNNGVVVVRTDASYTGLGTANVSRVEMTHVGSGGLDNIVFAPMSSTSAGCTLPLRHWKRNHSSWPLRNLTIGVVLYSKRALLDIMIKKPHGDKTYLIAEQLIAAHLNIASGADGSSFAYAMAAADQWLIAHGGVGSNQRSWDGGEWIKQALDAFNTGAAGPGACSSTPMPGTSDVDIDELTLDDASLASVPTTFALEGNYPNPFNPTTTIRFTLPEAANVRLSVYDLLGREVHVLVDGTLAAGAHTSTFDAAGLPSGSYLYRLETPAGAFSSLMTLTK